MDYSETTEQSDRHSFKPRKTEMEATLSSLKELSSAAPQPRESVDGGYGWVVVAMCVFLGSLGIGTTSSYGIFLPEYVEHYDISKTRATVVQSLGTGVAMAFGFLGGSLTRLLGYRTICTLAAMTASGGFLLSAFIDNFTVLCVTHGLLPGLSNMLTLNAGGMAVASYFRTKRALAMSIFTLGVQLGYAVWTPILRAFLRVYGRHGAMLMFAGIHMNGIAASLLLRPKKTVLKNDTNKAKKRIYLSYFLAEVSFFKDMQFILFLLSFAALTIGYVMPHMFIPARVQYMGISKDKGSLLLSLMGLGALSRPLFGLLGDKIPQHRTLPYGLAGAAAGMFMVSSAFCHSFALLSTFCIFGALFAGGYMGLQLTVLSDLLPIQQFAVAFGVNLSCNGVMTFLFNLLAGYLVDITGSFATAFVLVGSIQLGGGALAIALYLLQWGERRKDFSADLHDNNT